MGLKQMAITALSGLDLEEEISCLSKFLDDTRFNMPNVLPVN